MHPTHILFDIDDTLFSTKEFVHLARKNAVRHMIYAGLHKDEKKISQELDKIVKKFGSNYNKHFNELCKVFFKKPDPRLIAAGIYGYHITKAQIMPFPEVPKVLLQLREKGFKLYIASQGLSLKQWDKLFRLKIANYFLLKYITKIFLEVKP